MTVADQFGRNLAYCRRRAKLSQDEYRRTASEAKEWISLLCVALQAGAGFE